MELPSIHSPSEVTYKAGWFKTTLCFNEEGIPHGSTFIFSNNINSLVLCYKNSKLVHVVVSWVVWRKRSIYSHYFEAPISNVSCPSTCHYVCIYEKLCSFICLELKYTLCILYNGLEMSRCHILKVRTMHHFHR